MAMQLEKRLVEEWAIQKLKERGWNYVESANLNRSSFDEPLIIEDLKRKILEINKDTQLTEEDLKSVINELKSTPPDQNGHKRILKYLKYGVPVRTERERIVKYIQLFDYNNFQNNDFVVSNQFKFSGRDNIRLDILLIINGIPLVNIECKNPYTDKSDYFDAFKQIKRYEKVAPELYKYVQVGVGFAEVVKYFPIVPWLDNVRQEIWKWEGLKEDEAIFEMLRPETLLDILKNFIFVREVRGEMTKVIARYVQYRAVNRIYKRVIDNLAGKTNKNKGLIWHWQGSGKTLTMIFSAHKLYFEPKLEKPTIFFIVDRKDLERQFNDELSSLDLNFSFEKIESINELKEVLTHDDYRGKRGVFLALIHKFNLDEDFLLGELEEKGEVRKRKNIVCFLDEVHRTQYGRLALKMRNVLNNAFFFGFTGTPISSADRNTYREFGYIDEKELYLDKYFLDEAEKDGFIVPIVYELKREKIKLKDEDLEWYLEQIDVEDIADELEIRQLKSEVKKRINEIKVILENPEEIEKVCQDLAKHFKENFDGRFKGLIVAGSRKACVKYKEFLDKYLPSEYSEVVMTFNQDDEEEIKEYRRKLSERFKINNTAEIISQIIEKFRKEEYPKLLIVTDMLITGFDEPKLGVLYLHKPLKNHRLLQTIARINRPYFSKVAGFVVDYVGIFKFMEKAFKIYLEDDVKVIKKEIKERKDAFEDFLKILQELKNLFGNLVGDFKKDNFDKALERLKNEEIGNKFVNLYRNLRNWYEILTTDQRMIGYLEDYKWLSALYEYYKKLMRPSMIDEIKLEKYFQKTIELIHDLTEISNFKKIIGPGIIDLNYIKSLRESDFTQNQKTIGTIYALNYICSFNSKNPIYKSIAEKVKKLIKKWKENNIDIIALSVEVEDILNYIDEKEKEKEMTNLNRMTFGIKVILENADVIKKEDAEDIAKEIFEKIKDSFAKDWNKNPAILSDILRKIRRYLRGLRPRYPSLTIDELDKLHEEIFDFVQEYHE